MGTSIRLDSAFLKKEPDLRGAIKNVDLSSAFNTFNDPYIDDDATPSVWRVLGNLKTMILKDPKALADAIMPVGLNPYNVTNPIDALKSEASRAVNLVTGIGKDIGKTASNIGNYIGNATPASVASDIKDVALSPIEGIRNISNDPGGVLSALPGALAEQFLEVPIEALSGKKVENGEVVPLTPQEQTDAVEKTVGSVVQLIVAKKVSGSLLQTPNSLPEAVKLSQSKIGQLARTIKADAIAGAASGGAYGTIGFIGDEDQGAQIIANTLTYAPLGALFGAFGTKAYGDKVSAKALQLASDANDAAVSLAMLKNLKIDSTKSIKDLLSNIDAFATSDNLLEAAIRAKIDLGEGIVVPGLSQAKIDEISAKLHPGTPKAQPVYVAEGEIKRRAIVAIRTPVEFVDDFDKGAYMAAGGKKALKYAEEMAKKTGLSVNEIVAHGKRVREETRKIIVGQKYQTRDQVWLDTLEREVRERGRAELLVSIEGQKFKSADGRIWERKGDNIVSGTESYNINSEIAQKTIGRTANDIVRGAPFIQIPKIGFDPEFGKNSKGYYTYTSQSGDTFFSAYKLNDKTKEMFERTGFFPNEIVIHDGMVHRVIGPGPTKTFGSITREQIALRHIQSGKEGHMDAIFVRRQPLGINSTFYKADNERLANVGVLNQETFFDKMYSDFRKEFDLDKIPTDSYENEVLKFAQKWGMTDKGDIHNLEAAITSRLNKELLNTLDVDEKDAITNIMKALEDVDSKIRTNIGNQAHQAALTNNMYISEEGGGVYKVRLLDDNTVVGTVNSAEEALELINKSNQTNGPNFTQGNIPSSIGGLQSRFKPYEGKMSRFVDAMNTRGLISYLVPSQNFLASADANYGTKLLARVGQPMQVAVGRYKLFMEGPAKPVLDKFNKIVDGVKKYKITDDELVHITNALETMSAKEIRDKLLSRPMNPVEVNFADNLSKNLGNNTIEDVKNFLYDIKKDAEDAPFNSMEYKAALQKVVTTGKYSQEVIAAGNSLISTAMKQPQDIFSPYAVLRLAHALENPAQAVSRKEYIAKHKLRKEVLQLVEAFDKMYENAAVVYGIDSKARLNGYLPHIKIAKATGHNVLGSVGDDFVNEMARFGITPDNELLRNPIDIAYRYILAGGRVKSGYATAIKNASLAAKEELDKLSVSNPEAFRGIQDRVVHHIEDMRGIPSPDKSLSDASNKLLKHLGIKTPATTSVIAIADTAFQGFRLVMGLRDIHSAIGFTYAKYGAKFTGKVFASALSKDEKSFKLEVEKLIEQGAIPKVEGIDIVNPQDLFNYRESATAKIAELGLKWSGQKLVYTGTLMGVYKATVSEVADNLNKIVRKEISKEQAYKNIALSNHPPAVQAEFDKLVSDGDIEGASRFLGRWRGKEIANHFGNNNNPIGWNNQFGRIAGQYLSWSLNAIQTTADMASRGTRAERAVRMLRYTAFQAATIYAGYQVGMDLANWVTSPIGLIPKPGPIVTTAMKIAEGAGMLSTNEDTYNRAKYALNSLIPHSKSTIGQIYIPYSMAAQDLVQAYDLWFNREDIRGIPRAIGVKIDKTPEREMPIMKDLPFVR